MNRYVALDNIDYDTLKLCKSTKTPDSAAATSHNADSLLCQACRTVCRLGGDLATEAIRSIPSHLASTLLKEAIHVSQASAIANIIANWPLPVLR